MRELANARERWRLSRARKEGEIEPLPDVADDDLVLEPVPELDPRTIAKLMRYAGLKACQFAQETMQDAEQDMRVRMQAAQLLSARGWLDRPTDPTTVLAINAPTNGEFSPGSALALLNQVKP